MIKKCIAVGALCVAPLVLAQGPGMHGGPGFGPGLMGFGNHKVVTGAPYSADATNSMVQTLADGNTISRTSSGHVARDSQGRTYFQHEISAGPWAQKGPKVMTVISDPVAGYTYVLDTDKKTAIRRALRVPKGDWKPEHRAETAEAADASGLSPTRDATDLGTQNINGVQAQGKSVTRTIPANTIGNAQPLVEKSEVWTSPDLKIVVQSKRSDPRMGQSTYYLTNIQRSEPPATLFQVPADYTVRDGQSGWRRNGEPPANH